jgi:hypothetical protein
MRDDLQSRGRLCHGELAPTLRDPQCPQNILGKPLCRANLGAMMMGALMIATKVMSAIKWTSLSGSLMGYEGGRTTSRNRISLR